MTNAEHQVLIAEEGHADQLGDSDAEQPLIDGDGQIGAERVIEHAQRGRLRRNVMFSAAGLAVVACTIFVVRSFAPFAALFAANEVGHRGNIVQAFGTSNCAAEWAQCGGQAWTGATSCCAVGVECVVQSAWWSSCKKSPQPAGQPTPSQPVTKPPPQTQCADEWKQCGGAGWFGASCCVAGLDCNVQSKWYSQCNKPEAPAAPQTIPPASVPTTPPAAVPTSPPASVPTSSPASVPASPSAPATASLCTGDAEVDAVLSAANLPAAMEMNKPSSVYTWDGFCSAVRAMKGLGMPLFEGEGAGPARVSQVLSNMASLLSQCSWESGGDAPWTACDENNFLASPTASCTQRHDGQRYDSLTGPPACVVDRDMRMTAETFAGWTPGPMSCIPGTATAGCCWWGRGAIQTTGPHNYRMLQDKVVASVSSLSGVDLCTNPEAMCQYDELKWLGALYYWTSVVQKASQFTPSLRQFVSSSFSSSSFNAGTGGMVNNGMWTRHAHGNAGRMRAFDQIINALKQAGMGSAMPIIQPVPSAVSVPAPPDVGGEWTWWSGGSSGITYHGPEYSIERYCSSGKPVGDMCWRLANDEQFTKTTLPKFCARTDVRIAFGHPDVQKCGECSELRVKRRDGGYNYIIVMTTDHPYPTNTSPELSDLGKTWLDQDTANGVACPAGGGPSSVDCAMGDRLAFEYRKVPCVQ